MRQVLLGVALTLACGSAFLGCVSTGSDDVQLADQEPHPPVHDTETQPELPPFGSPRAKLPPGEVIDEQERVEQQEAD